jgi:hypothetical protein
VNPFNNETDQQLLILYSDLMEELRIRSVIRSSNNPVADYAEKVAVESLNLIRANKEELGYDAIDPSNNRYQIKGRRTTKHNKSRQLGVIRNLNSRPFDFLVTVIFNEDFSVNEIWKIPFDFIEPNSRYSSHQNGHIFIANPDLLSSGSGVIRIK